MKQLRERLAELHDELEATRSVDDGARQALESVMRDIQKLLEQSGEDPAPTNPSLSERLDEATRHFETTHPTLAATMGRVIDALTNLGI